MRLSSTCNTDHEVHAAGQSSSIVSDVAASNRVYRKKQRAAAGLGYASSGGKGLPRAPEVLKCGCMTLAHCSKKFKWWWC